MYVGRTGYGQFEIISQHYSGGTKKDTDQSQESLCPHRDSNRVNSEYKTAPLALESVLPQNNHCT